jgi:hypothetical protein
MDMQNLTLLLVWSFVGSAVPVDSAIFRREGSNAPSGKAQDVARLIAAYRWIDVSDHGAFIVSNRVIRWFDSTGWEVEVLPVDAENARHGRHLAFDLLRVKTPEGQAQVTLCQMRSFSEAQFVLAESHTVISTAPELDVRWKDMPIGTVAAGFRRNGAASEPYECVTFARGNVAVIVTSRRANYTDPRAIAEAIDRYLLARPTVPNAAERSVEKVALTVQPSAMTHMPPIEVPHGLSMGTDHALLISPPLSINGPRQLATDTEQAQVGPEVQIRAAGGSVSRTEEGTYTVRFHKAGEQAVEYCYLDKAGKVVGYGKTEVTVVPGPTTRPGGSEKQGQ